MIERYPIGLHVLYFFVLVFFEFEITHGSRRNRMAGLDKMKSICCQYFSLQFVRAVSIESQ